MTDRAAVTPGDRAKVSVRVKIPPPEAFRIFTEEIDRWWRRGLRYRMSSGGRSMLHLEPKLGGRLFESFEDDGTPRVVETGRVLAWEPPNRFKLEWRLTNFAPNERTELEVCFEPAPSGTLVTVVHSGWAALPPDHPARHGLQAAAFIRATGLWWGELLSALRAYAESAPGFMS